MSANYKTSLHNTHTIMKHLFLLDPKIIFLNHGSFGATPKPVLETYQDWQRQLETQPVRFLSRELNEHLSHARQVLGTFLNADADDLVFIPNATYGVNTVARSLKLTPGDEILASNHEYGACDRTWKFICQKTGAKYIKQSVDLPVREPEEIVDQIWAGVSDQTQLIFLSHITSPTAITLPVEHICARARNDGILTMIDGAHAPGQIDLNLQAIAADFYTGNCHKWMMAPKGSAFLHSRREYQHLLEPLVVSWGWQAEETYKSGSEFIDHHQWVGTHDPAAYLSVPAAIKFQQDYNWKKVRQSCQELVGYTIQMASQITDLPPIYTIGSDSYHQMAALPLPKSIDPLSLKTWLYEEEQIEIPCHNWEEAPFIRISVQGYNTQEDVETFLTALKQALTQPGLRN